MLDKTVVSRRHRYRLPAVLFASSLAALPASAQGIGPPDLGWFNHVVIGGWLLFWIGACVYPLAVLVFLAWRIGTAAGKTWQPDSGTPSPARAIFRWAVAVHLGLTAALTALFALAG